MEDEEFNSEEGIEMILKERTKNKEVHYLVKWIGEDEPVWMNEEEIVDDYPYTIKKFQESKKAVQKEHEKEKESKKVPRTFKPSSSPSYSQQKAPRFIRKEGKLIYAKAKELPQPIAVIIPPSPPPLSMSEQVLRMLSEIQGK